MNMTILTRIETEIGQLSFTEQILLMESLARQIRRHVQSRQTVLEDDLAAMAADPAIQRELRLIEEEFAVAALDGLETLA